MREGMMSEGSDENIYKPYTGQRSICGSRTTAGEENKEATVLTPCRCGSFPVALLYYVNHP